MFATSDPVMEKLDLNRCYTKIINYQTAANMVIKYHYAHRAPSIVVAIGMYVDDRLAGLVTYGTPPVPNVQRAFGDAYQKNTLELNRLFIHDWAGFNSESWLIAQSFRWMEKMFPQYFLLVSYADSKEGHTGAVYRATNWIYTGMSEPMKTGFIIDGHDYHNKSLVDMIGSCSESVVKQYYPNAQPVSGGAKHRYVFILGDRRQKKKFRKLLRWPILPYPTEDSNEVKIDTSLLSQKFINGFCKELAGEFLLKEYLNGWTPDNPTFGYCYLISEALYHYGTGYKRFRPYYINLGEPHGVHWYLSNGHDIVDFTCNQFVFEIDHSAGRRHTFLQMPTMLKTAKGPISKKAHELAIRMEKKLNGGESGE